MDALSAWSEEMLRLDAVTLTRLMKLGARVSAVMQRTSRGRATPGRSVARR